LNFKKLGPKYGVQQARCKKQGQSKREAAACHISKKYLYFFSRWYTEKKTGFGARTSLFSFSTGHTEKNSLKNS
jgi:hypothetical protein